MDDIFQQRYIDHQKDKAIQLSSQYGWDSKKLGGKYKKYLSEIINRRSSQRNFNRESITNDEIDFILQMAGKSPSSCNRHGVGIRIIESRDEKQLLGGILVGGAGWVHRADKVLMLIGHYSAYKEGLDYMKYLDAGSLITPIYLACEVLNIGACYINPNIRDNHKYIMDILLDNNEDLVFCGAIAIGKYDKKAIPKPSEDLNETGAYNS